MSAIFKEVNIPEFIKPKKPYIAPRKAKKIKVKKYTFKDYCEVILEFLFMGGLIFTLCLLAG